MTKDEIIEMVNPVGSKSYSPPPTRSVAGVSMTFAQLEAFAKLVRNDYSNKHAQLWLKRIDEAVKEERESCAKLADEMTMPDWVNEQIAKAIRARSSSRGEAA